MAKDSKGHGSNKRGSSTKAKTYMVQARLGDQFEDIHVKASSAAKAIAAAKKRTNLRHRFTKFVL